jgi:hypothetical protein
VRLIQVSRTEANKTHKHEEQNNNTSKPSHCNVVLQEEKKLQDYEENMKTIALNLKKQTIN